jgi:hypothetical protein
VRAACIAFAAAVVGLLCLPLLFTGGGPPAPPRGTDLCPVPGGRLAVALATIRTVESGGNYTARAAGSSASGAYQFIDTTWAGYGGYPEAWMAPPAIQDAKAAINVSAVLAGQHGDVTAVPVVWYIGHLPPPDSTEWDTVPSPEAGNVLTPRQYQAKWMAVYDAFAGTAPPPTGGTEPVGTGCGATAATTTTTLALASRPARK